MRWLRGVLVAFAVLASACGDDGTADPAAAPTAEESKRFCDQLLADDSGENDLERAVPDALKDDFEKWRAGNDPEKAHVGRLNDYARKECGVPFDEPGFTTTTGATTTSATVAP